MSSQKSIPKHKITRAASLATTGAKIGMHYLKYSAKQKLGKAGAKESFHEETAEDTYAVFSKLKGGPLKVAQMLSLDQNLLPAPYIEQFKKAQYTAPPLSYPLVVRSFKKEFGKAPNEIFDTFSKEAVAGASIGQVHKATIGDRTYAVKVQYPGVADSLESDLKMVKPFAMRLFNLSAETLDHYLVEVEARLVEETDYLLELKRSQELANLTKDIEGVYFPEYYPELSSKKIITMDWVEGMHLDEFAQSSPTQEERNQVGQALWDFYHYQVHELRIFHADPHAGNFKVHDGKLWVFDFGCVKDLNATFYRKYFALMANSDLSRAERFKELLYELQLLREDDGDFQKRKLIPLFRDSVELLSRPFKTEFFDFGNKRYSEELFEFGDRMKEDQDLQQMQSGRGDAEALYLNRTYFGLYNLEAQLKAKISANMPQVHRDELALPQGASLGG